jgi:CHASE2 domain
VQGAFAVARRTRNPGGRKRWLEDYRHHLPKSLYVAAVMASIIHILNALNLPLELPATMLLANVAELYVPEPPERKDVRRHVAVVEIDSERHRSEYYGTSPLHRCKLASDLTTLLANKNLRLLAIDFDLSPIDAACYQYHWPILSRSGTAPPDMDKKTKDRCEAAPPEQARCQQQLEGVLENQENHGRIITIAPITPTEGRTKGQPWDNPKDFPHVEFGDPELDVRFGMVHDYEFPPPGYVGSNRVPFAELIARRLCSETDLPYKAPRSLTARALDWFATKTGWNLPAPADRCNDVPRPQRPESNHPSDRQDDRKFTKRAISFFETRNVHDGSRPLAFDDACLTGDRTETGPECDIRFVVFGGSYGIEDRYLTALGKMSGVQLHAAIAAQLRADTWHGWGFLGDIALGGLVFGPFVHWAWRRYFLQRAQATRSRAVWGHPNVAFRWLLILGLGLLVLVALLVYGSAGLYAYWGIWVSPMPMALGMLVEAVVSGSIHVANHVIRDVHTTAFGAAPTTPEPAKRAAALFGKLPCALAISLILGALYLIHTH